MNTEKKETQEALNEEIKSGVSPNSKEETPTISKEVAKEGESSASVIASATSPPDDVRLPPITFFVLVCGVCLANFVVALDTNIITTALPSITSTFGTIQQVGWYGSAYMLAMSAVQPSFGRCYTIFSVKPVFCVAIAAFELGSVLCAAANSSAMFVAGRAVAGAGAAGVFAESMTIITRTVPLEARSFYIAIVSSMFGISSILGPTVGGALTDGASWRMCFWINLPIGAVAIATVLIFFRSELSPGNDTSGSRLTILDRILDLDILGALLIIGGVSALFMALEWGGSVYRWSDSRQFLRGERATIPGRVISRRSVLSCYIFAFMINVGAYVHMYYMPIYFQAVKGKSATTSGLLLVPYLVSNIAMSLLTSLLIMKVGCVSPFMIVGAACFTIGSGLLVTLRVDTSFAKSIGYQILTGGGAGLSVQVPFVAVQALLDPSDAQIGVGLAIFANSLGGAMSTSIAQNIFSNSLARNLARDIPTINPEQIINTGVTELRRTIPVDSIVSVLEAYVSSIDDSFILPVSVGGFAFLASLFVEWKSIKPAKQPS
ncbi:MFS general substrate transporter [Periconia macrospinosa]|uniref:MFS general substrate transporter n=1 Tax=Periconia macrospinosa TaxID=97972 RepID=A0A2V1DFQ5_9PLEO|nr:MFS general substrate transporter [Periconia macrospinosa]